jgi:effector-binding domain-containing protein
MNYEFRILQTPERSLMGVSTQAKPGELPKTILGSLDKVWAYLKKESAKADHNVVVYRAYDRVSGIKDIDVGVQVDSPLPGNGLVVPLTTPAGLVATTTHIGPYEKLGDASTALIAFCRDQGHPIVGPMWEEYGDWNADPSQLRTEVFARIAR